MLHALKMAEQIEMTDLRKETREQLATMNKYTGLEATMAAELMIGFWFGILAIGVVDGLNYCIGALTGGGSK